MAKRRTRKQKQSANQQYQLPSTKKSSPKVSVEKAAKPATTKAFTAWDLYDYDTALIKKDLIKTIVVSAIILALEFGIYYYLQSK